MYFRLSRLRFVLVRYCVLFLIFILILELKLYFQTDEYPKKNAREILFWNQLYNQDRYLTNQQRIEQIQLIEKQKQFQPLNWTRIFYEIYQRKTEKLYEKDKKNAYKYQLKRNHQNLSQNLFQIFEETLVNTN